MAKKKENCFKCGILTDDLISFHFIDDWSQFEIKLCQDCTSKANIQGFESSEEWLCPICKKVYCCTICGDKNHHTKNCAIYIPDYDDLPFYFKQLFSSFRKRTFQWYAHTPYGIIPFGEVDKASRERSEMQTLLMNIRKKTMKKMPEIAEMIKYYFNSKYGESAEGIVSPAILIEKIKEFVSRSTVDNDSDWDFDNLSFQSIINKSKAVISKKVLEQAIYKHAIYMDIDSFSLNILSIKDVLKEIINYPVNKNLILVTGDRGLGKTSVVIALIEKWKEIDSIDSEMFFSIDSETWRVYYKQRKYDFIIIPSLIFNNDDIFKQTCLIINVEQRIDYNKEMKVILYWLSKRINSTEIVMVSQAIISYCSNEGYEQYKDKKLKLMMDFKLKLMKDFKYGESIINSAEMSKKIIQEAIRNFAVYQDTDSFIFNTITIKEIISQIKEYDSDKFIIVVTGDRGIGKSSAVLEILEQWKKEEWILYDINYRRSSEQWRVLTTKKRYEFHVVPSLPSIMGDIMRQTCLRIHIVQRTDYNKEMRAMVFWYSKEFLKQDKIIMANQVTIPYCSKELYNLYIKVRCDTMRELYK